MEMAYEKLPKIGSMKDLDNCMVPFIENKSKHSFCLYKNKTRSICLC